MRKGDVIRQANGADYTLWRVEETYEEDSPYVLGLLVSNYKTYYKAGTKKRMIAKKDYKVEPDPEGYVKGTGLRASVDLSVSLETARWG